MKPHFRFSSNSWRKIDAALKPRVKPAASGELLLLCPGRAAGAADHQQMRSDIRARYGSFTAFAQRWNLRPNAVRLALSPYGAGYAGQARNVRLLLGMASSPSRHACDIASVKARRGIRS